MKNRAGQFRPGPATELTEVEKTILDLFSQGLNIKEVSAERMVAVDTTKTQVKKIRHKLRAKNTLHAVAIVLREGIIE